MTDPKVLDELDRLEKTATPGPWKDDSYNLAFARRDHEYARGKVAVFTIPDHPIQDEYYNPEQIAERSWWYKESDANKLLAIVLRNNASSLIADARRLQRIEAAAQHVMRMVDFQRNSECGLPMGLALDHALECLRMELEYCGAGAVECEHRKALEEK